MDDLLSVIIISSHSGNIPQIVYPLSLYLYIHLISLSTHTIYIITNLQLAQIVRISYASTLSSIEQECLSQPHNNSHTTQQPIDSLYSHLDIHHYPLLTIPIHLIVSLPYSYISMTPLDNHLLYVYPTTPIYMHYYHTSILLSISPPIYHSQAHRSSHNNIEHSQPHYYP